MLRVLGGLALMAVLGVGGALAFFGDEPLRQSGFAPNWPSLTGEPVVQASATRSVDDNRAAAVSPAPSSTPIAASAVSAQPTASTAPQAAPSSSRFSPEFLQAVGASLETSVKARQELTSSLESTRTRLAAVQQELEAARADASQTRMSLAEAEDARALLERSIATGAIAGAAAAGDPAAEAQLRAALRSEVEGQVRRELRPTLEREIEAELRPVIEQSLRDELRTASIATGSVTSAGASGGATGLGGDRSSAASAGQRTALASVNAAVCGQPSGPRGPGDVFATLEGEAQPYASYIEGPFASQNSHPWAASLKIVETPADQFGNGEIAQRCSGAVIDGGWIVTAAHCVTPGAFEHIEVTVGSTDLYSPDAYTARASQAICHSGYDHRYFSLANDIALIPLDRPLPRNIATIDVATPEQVFSLPFATQTYSAGWGAVAFGDNGALTSSAQYLKAVDLQLRDVHGAHLYASDDNPVAGVCLGDSGGPLTIGSGAEATLIGIASHVHTSEGKYCKTTDDLSVFTNVGIYRDWIDSVMSLCASRDDC